MCRYGILHGHQDRVTVFGVQLDPAIWWAHLCENVYVPHIAHCKIQKWSFVCLDPVDYLTLRSRFSIFCACERVWIESDRIGILYVNTSNQPKYAKCLERQITCKWCKSAIARHHYLIYSVSMVGLVRFVTCFLFFVCCCTHLHITLGFLAENPLVFNKKQRTRIKQRRK